MFLLFFPFPCYFYYFSLNCWLDIWLLVSFCTQRFRDTESLAFEKNVEKRRRGRGDGKLVCVLSAWKAESMCVCVKRSSISLVWMAHSRVFLCSACVYSFAYFSFCCVMYVCVYYRLPFLSFQCLFSIRENRVCLGPLFLITYVCCFVCCDFTKFRKQPPHQRRRHRHPLGQLSKGQAVTAVWAAGLWLWQLWPSLIGPTQQSVSSWPLFKVEEIFNNNTSLEPTCRLRIR